MLSNIFNLNNINTPLYDPNNKLNTEKINYLIHQNFKGEDLEIPELLNTTTIYSDLVDMMNFKLPNFNKSISLSPSSTIKIESKWKLKKLSSVVDIISGGTPLTTVAEYWNGNIPWLSVADFNNGNRFVSETEKKITQLGFDNSNTNYLVPDEIILSARGTVGAFAQVAKRMTFNQSCYGLRAKDDITNSYLYYVLGELLMQFKAKAYGSKFDAITVSTFDEILIPVPPPKIQEQIVEACSAIDKEAEKARKSLNDLRKEIEDLFEEAFSKAKANFRIGDTDYFEMSIGKRVLKTEINNNGIGIPVYSANVFEPFGHIKKELLENFDVPSVLWGIDGDWMVNYIPENAPFYPTDHCGVLRVKSDKINPKYLAWVLQKEGERVRFSRTNRASMDSMRGLSVKAPPKEIQSKLVKEVEKREKKIKESQQIIAGIVERKETIIKSLLMGEVAEPELSIAAEPEIEYKKGKKRSSHTTKRKYRS